MMHQKKGSLSCVLSDPTNPMHPRQYVKKKIQIFKQGSPEKGQLETAYLSPGGRL